MTGRSLCCFLLFLVTLNVTTLWAQQEGRKRVLKTPGLVLVSSAPIATTHCLTFIDGGNQLLAAGGDKVVRCWPVTDSGIDSKATKTLLWPAWREERGTIYAMAVSPDQQHVAVAGQGVTTGLAAAIIDRQSGELKHSLKAPGHSDVVTALDFSKSGDSLFLGTRSGGVYSWSIAGGDKACVRIGSHGNRAIHQVLLVKAVGDRQVLSVSRDGGIRRWDPRRKDRTAIAKHQFDSKDLDSVVFNSTANLLAASSVIDYLGTVEFKSLDGTDSKKYQFDEGTQVEKLAFNAEGKRLAASLVKLKWSKGCMAGSGKVATINLESGKLTELSLSPSYLVDTLAFHPDGNRLAVAGGSNHEVELWDLDREHRIDRLQSPGAAIWDVGFARTGTKICIKQERNIHPSSHNDRGAGKWRVFDLQRRDWNENTTIADPILPLESFAGWSLKPDRRGGRFWQVSNQKGKSYQLPWDREHNASPTCFTFLKPIDDYPVRLAVGHRYGISIYELTNDGLVYSRVLIGHSDDVTCIAPSADHSLLLSGSRDQTVSAWSLKSWPHQRELGADFTLDGQRVITSEVATGSPAWEAGLTPGDEMKLFAFDGELLQGGPASWQARLKRPVPRKEFYFELGRKGEPETIKTLTTIRQRPLWRFFSDRDGQWVVWRWLDYFYDCSVTGDTRIGWQIMDGIDQAPRFLRAEQAREQFYRPEKLENLLSGKVTAPVRVAADALVPPKVELRLTETSDGYQAVVKLATPDEAALSGEPQELSLWIGDHRVKRWSYPRAPYQQKVSFSLSDLRPGMNRVIARAYSNTGVRGDSEVRTLEATEESDARLFILAIGINNYSRLATSQFDRGNSLNSLEFAVRDAIAFEKVLRKQSLTYSKVSGASLLEADASRRDILQQFEKLKKLRPNDQLVLFFAGHGYAKPRGSGIDPTTLTFLTHDSQLDSLARTGIPFSRSAESGSGLSAFSLFDSLSNLKCRKLVVIDACHSGGGADLIRALTPDFSVGPTILVAADGNQKAFSSKLEGHGIFTYALLQSLTEHFPKADLDGDGWLSAKEMHDHTKRRVPQLLNNMRPLIAGRDSISIRQNPVIWCPSEELTRPLFKQSLPRFPFIDW